MLAGIDALAGANSGILKGSYKIIFKIYFLFKGLRFANSSFVNFRITQNESTINESVNGKAITAMSFADKEEVINKFGLIIIIVI